MRRANILRFHINAVCRYAWGLGHAIKTDKGGGDMTIVACADLAWDDADPSTDYKVWKDW